MDSSSRRISNENPSSSPPSSAFSFAELQQSHRASSGPESRSSFEIEEEEEKPKLTSLVRSLQKLQPLSATIYKENKKKEEKEKDDRGNPLSILARSIMKKKKEEEAREEERRRKAEKRRGPNQREEEAEREQANREEEEEGKEREEKGQSPSPAGESFSPGSNLDQLINPADEIREEDEEQQRKGTEQTNKFASLETPWAQRTAKTDQDIDLIETRYPSSFPTVSAVSSASPAASSSSAFYPSAPLSSASSYPFLPPSAATFSLPHPSDEITFVESKQTGEFVRLTKRDFQQYKNNQEKQLSMTSRPPETVVNLAAPSSSATFFLSAAFRQFNRSAHFFQTLLHFLFFLFLSLLVGISLFQLYFVYHTKKDTYQFLLQYSSSAEGIGILSFIFASYSFAFAIFRCKLESFPSFHIDFFHSSRYFYPFNRFVLKIQRGGGAEQESLRRNQARTADEEHPHQENVISLRLHAFLNLFLFLALFIVAICTFLSAEMETIMISAWRDGTDVSVLASQSSISSKLSHFFSYCTARFICSAFAFLLLLMKLFFIEFSFLEKEGLRYRFMRRLTGGIGPQHDRKLTDFMETGSIYRSNPLNIKFVDNMVEAEEEAHKKARRKKAGQTQGLAVTAFSSTMGRTAY